MKITKTEYELSPEESAVMLCELAHENVTINIQKVSASDKTVNDLLQQAELYRMQKRWGGNV
ncbi:hypothetical protein CLNEO_05190 [Anaerotignum neopropionicum]|uniref:Uncharacterized protein n=1 Tax=Anaerotignum neopropionicum TaxID=36847 RepID=A0A136WIZ7_9FIRM|nr:hypothetical protein [Anaerotignum neopropionicum]KXL54413.1 hypothetical protein CLNEO_05190 [Anaerotignum neopropionicum]